MPYAWIKAFISAKATMEYTDYLDWDCIPGLRHHIVMNRGDPMQHFGDEEFRMRSRLKETGGFFESLSNSFLESLYSPRVFLFLHFFRSCYLFVFTLWAHFKMLQVIYSVLAAGQLVVELFIE